MKRITGVIAILIFIISMISIINFGIDRINKIENGEMILVNHNEK